MPTISRRLTGRVSVCGIRHDETVTRRGFVLFAALSIAWGVPYLFIAIAVDELDPATVVLGRSALGALALLPLALFRRQVMPVLRRWRPLLVYTAIEIVIPWYFISSAETRLPSSTVGLLIAAVPLVGVGVAFAFGRPERLSIVNWAGIVLGMAGVAALVGFEIGGSDLLAVGEIAIVVVAYAIGPAILSRYLSDVPGVGVVAVSLAITALVYLPIVSFTGGWPAAAPSPPAVLSIVVLALVCSAAAFLLMIALIAEIGPVRTTAITYVSPAVAIIAGVLVLGERITIWTGVGFALVLAGSYLVTKRRRPVPEAPPGPASAPAVVEGADDSRA
jgi:drug/metabolite transporter (DMT)-like permease